MDAKAISAVPPPNAVGAGVGVVVGEGVIEGILVGTLVRVGVIAARVGMITAMLVLVGGIEGLADLVGGSCEAATGCEVGTTPAGAVCVRMSDTSGSSPLWREPGLRLAYQTVPPATSRISKSRVMANKGEFEGLSCWFAGFWLAACCKFSRE